MRNNNDAIVVYKNAIHSNNTHYDHIAFVLFVHATLYNFLGVVAYIKHE